MINTTIITRPFRGSHKIVILFFILLSSLLFSCSSKKRIEKLLYEGDYDNVIRQSVNILIKGKENPKNQPYVLFLEDAYQKAVERDLQRIKLLMLDHNKALYTDIYDIYGDLQQRQDLIRPLLPLYIKDEDSYAKFQLYDFSEDIAHIKREMSNYVYDNALRILNSKKSSKHEFREAYSDLEFVLQVNPGYKNSKELMSELRVLGTDFVHVYTRNDTRMMIPGRLEDDLLNFSTWGLNNKWKVYHTNRLSDLNYDYAIIISFREINISPEQVKERQFTLDKRIEVGDTIRKDKSGNVLKDVNGRELKDKVYKLIKADIIESRQLKTCQVVARVDYLNLNTEQIINSYPLEGAFVFENIFARYRGDNRALDDKYRRLTKGAMVPFPPNEKMILDCSESLKNNLKRIISREDASKVVRKR